MKFFLMLFIYLSLSFNLFAGNKLAVLDFDRIFKDSLQYKKMVNSINYFLYKKYLSINNEINILIKNTKKINNNLNLVNNKKKNNLILFLNNKKKQLYNKINNLEIYINNKNISLHNLFLIRIQKIINYIIKHHKYDVIIDSNAIFYFSKNISNITDYIINKLS